MINTPTKREDMCQMKRECAETFKRIEIALARLVDMANKVDLIHRSLFGNGEPKNGLVTKVDRLEEAALDVKSNWKTIRRRMVDLAVAVVLVYVGTKIR